MNNTEQYEEGLVSIVTPVYNGETFIDRFLLSIMQQTYPRLQLILVDDGSVDHTAEVIKQWTEKLNARGISFLFLRNAHKNASAAINTGLKYVKGEYLIWPDSDDILEKDSIAIRVQFLKEHPKYHCVRSLACYFDPITGDRKEADERQGDLFKEDLFWDILEGKTFVCCGCYMLRTKDFFAIYPDRHIPEYDVGQNFQMLLPFMYKYHCPTIQKELYRVAVRAGSHSRRKRSESENVQKYKAYEALLDDIASICNIHEKEELNRITCWKRKRRVQLALKYRRCLYGLRQSFTIFPFGIHSGLYCLAQVMYAVLRYVVVCRPLRFIYHVIKGETEIRDLIRNGEWALYKRRKRRRLKELPTIIASNCTGTMIYHDLRLPFLSPTINLCMEMNDFVKFVRRMRWYLDQDIQRLEDTTVNYPTGMLADIKIRFVHYDSFGEAVTKWNERKKRIKWDRLFIIGCEKDGCTYETLCAFDQLPYKNKVIFTKREYPEIQSAFYIHGFENCEELGTVTNYKKQFWIRRYMDEFDYVTFLNGKQ